MVHHSPLLLILKRRIDIKPNTDHIIRDGIMESGFAVGWLISFGRVVYIPAAVEQMHDGLQFELLLIFEEKGLFGASDEVADTRLLHLQVFIEGVVVGPERDVLQLVLLV